MLSNLVILPIGNKSLTNQWFGKKNFDLWTFNYDDSGIFDIYADKIFQVPLFKYHAIKYIIDTNDISQYKYIWLPDDDLQISTEDVNKMFAIADKHDLMLGQPSVTGNLTWHWYLRNRKGFYLRWTNFIEVMCPFFSNNFIHKCLDTFVQNLSSYGIDVEWSFRTNPNKTAIIDSVSVKHIREVYSGELYNKLKNISVDPEKELKIIFDKFGLKNGTLDFINIEGGVDF